MLIEGQVECFSPQSTAEVSQEKAAVISQTVAVNGDKDLNVKKKKENYVIKPQNASKLFLSEVIQVS